MDERLKSRLKLIRKMIEKFNKDFPGVLLFTSFFGLEENNFDHLLTICNADSLSQLELIFQQILEIKKMINNKKKLSKNSFFLVKSEVETDFLAKGAIYTVREYKIIDSISMVNLKEYPPNIMFPMFFFSFVLSNQN